MEEFVIVGGGIAGVSCAEEVSARAGKVGPVSDNPLSLFAAVQVAS